MPIRTPPLQRLGLMCCYSITR